MGDHWKHKMEHKYRVSFSLAAGLAFKRPIKYFPPT